MPCDLLIPPDFGPQYDMDLRSNRLCHQPFPSLPPVTGCFGDSGGPMVVCEGDRIVVIGVSSYGYNLDHPENHTCEKERTLGVYADIQAHLSWIKEKIGEGNNK